MSRELTSLDSVLEIERQVHEQEHDLKAQLQKAERRKTIRSIMLTVPWCASFCSPLHFPS
ncbi:spermidine Putrescine ABC transporter permease component PotB [Vibrio sp. JCM 19052]|nr:spermidine Putrescine ABC transporter permease component PotB [Vibrio sp. JCM 19052]